jgi:chromosome segregation ATPase
MKLKTLITIGAAISLLVLPCACDRNNPEVEQTRKELKDAQKTLAEMQAVLQKIKADINDVQNEKKLLNTQFEQAKTDLQPASKALDQFNRQADALAAELETAKAKITSVTKSIDELQQRVSAFKTERNEGFAEVKPQAAPGANSYKPNEQTNKPHAVAKPQHDPSLARKLQEAESYVQAGNWQAAERLLLEIQAADPNYPGLDALNSRVQNMKIGIRK